MKILTTLFVLLLSTQLHADIADVKEGLWEITSTVSMSSIPAKIPPLTQEKCVTRQSLDPEALLKKQNCQVTKNEQASNSLSFSMSCEQQGMKMEGSGSIRYQAKSFEGQFDLNMSGGASPMTMTTDIKGHYVGACQ